MGKPSLYPTIPDAYRGVPKQDELDKILDKLLNEQQKMPGYRIANIADAESAINSLTLKQVLEVIEKAKPSFVFTANLEGSKLGRIVGKALDKYEAELKQEAERIWS